MQSPMGAITDAAVLDQATLAVRQQTIEPGPVNIKLAFRDKKAGGTMSMIGQDKPVSADLGGPVFANDAGSMECIATLPLAEGYATSFRNFEVQSQKEKLMALKASGVESVTGGAGTFDSYKIEITSADGGRDKQTIWIARDSRKP